MRWAGSGDRWGTQRWVVRASPLTPTTPPRFVCKNSGVLFENQLLQIGVKSEFRQNLGVSWWPRGGMGVLKGWDC